MATISVFLDFSLPNATTWFYFSWLLAIALFFRFSRVLSMRNWDVLTLFLLVPGLLVIQASRTTNLSTAQQPAIEVASAIGLGGGHGLGVGTGAAGAAVCLHEAQPRLDAARWLWWGYLWLLCGSGYFLFRCFLDLALIKRPALAPNLGFGGLAWFGGALMVCLIAVAFRPLDTTPRLPAEPVSPGAVNASTTVGQESPAFQRARERLDAGPIWLKRAFAVFGHIAVVAGLALIGWRHFQDSAGGMAAAVFYLMLPYTGVYVGQAHHVWPMALMVWAVACYKMPTLAGVFLGLAAGTMYFPVVVVPLWCGFYWKRGAGRFLAALLIVGSIGFGLLWLEGALVESVQAALAQSAWQPWRVPTTESFWTGVHWAYRIPIFLAYVALLVIATIWPWPKNLAQIIAMSAAMLIGIQFWYADQGGVYVLWYMPLLLLLVFRPNLDDRRALEIAADADWLTTLKKGTGTFFKRLAIRNRRSPHLELRPLDVPHREDERPRSGHAFRNRASSR